jgi:hypothetical protein
MTLHLETWQVVLIGLVVLADVLAGIRLWTRQRRAERTIAAIRQLAEDHVAYMPDDLVRSTRGPVFERASGYWSRMVLRELDHPDPNALVRRRR